MSQLNGFFYPTWFFISPFCFSFILSFCPHTYPLFIRTLFFCFFVFVFLPYFKSIPDNLNISREIFSVLHKYFLHLGFFLTFERKKQKQKIKKSLHIRWYMMLWRKIKLHKLIIECWGEEGWVGVKHCCFIRIIRGGFLEEETFEQILAECKFSRIYWSGKRDTKVSFSWSPISRFYMETYKASPWLAYLTKCYSSIFTMVWTQPSRPCNPSQV